MNYLYFNNGGDTSIMYPASSLKGIDLRGATNLDLYFKSAHVTKVTGTATEDLIVLKITINGGLKNSRKIQINF